MTGLGFIVVLWILQGALAGWLANERGRDFFPWLITGVIFGPLAVIAVGLAPVGTTGVFKACVECQMGVPADATRCPYCRTDLIRAEAEEIAASQPGA